jgi:hypothetical protein
MKHAMAWRWLCRLVIVAVVMAALIILSSEPVADWILRILGGWR